MLIDQLDPKVLIIDDIEKDISAIKDALGQRYVSYEFIDASPDKFKAPEQPYKRVELIFLDLFYNGRFDPDVCAQIVQSAIPENHPYALVIWSKDTQEAQAVLDELKSANRAPYQALIKQKTNFLKGDDEYDIEKLLSEINREAEETVKTELIHGEIMIVDDDSVIVDCLIDKDNKTIQLRRFDKEPFEKALDLTVGGYIDITIITRPGSKLFEFSNNDEELKDLFSKDDLFNDEDLSMYYGN